MELINLKDAENNFDIVDRVGFVYDDEIINHKVKDREAQIDVYSFIDSNDIVLSLGSGRGSLPIYINKKLFAGANHVVVEPFSKRINVLEKNKIRHNAEFDVITYLPVKIDDKSFVYDDPKKQIVLDNTINLASNVMIIPNYSFDYLIKSKLLFYSAIVCDSEYVTVLYNILQTYKYVVDNLQTVMYRVEIDKIEKTEQVLTYYLRVKKDLGLFLYENGFRLVRSPINDSIYTVWKRV